MRGRFKYVVFLFIICIFTAFFLSSSFFQIKFIAVNGTNNVTREEIIKLSSIYYGENIFRINKKNSMKSIFQNPYVKMIKIKRGIPNRVVIDIIEREIMAYVPYVGSYLNIDEEGMILEINPAIKRPDLPIVKGLKFETFKVGERLSIENKEQFSTITMLIKEIKNAGMLNLVSEIDVTSLTDIKLKIKDGIKANLGGADNMNYKINFAKSIVEDVKNQKLKGTLEMSHKGNPVFKPE
ncbi:MAG TPA: FtsQ-type POTRA domain-containing protein [Patescibacteria group bacterium]|nr:FtsQ-type POTRA domain-containing protein [Patescibacteria group bacterium]